MSERDAGRAATLRAMSDAHDRIYRNRPTIGIPEGMEMHVRSSGAFVAYVNPQPPPPAPGWRAIGEHHGVAVCVRADLPPGIVHVGRPALDDPIPVGRGSTA